MKGVASDEWPEKKNGALSPLENVEVHWVGVLRPRNTRAQDDNHWWSAWWLG